MLLNVGTDTGRIAPRMRPGGWVGPAVLALILLAELVYALASGASTGSAARQPPPGTAVAPNQVGASMFTTYLLGVELASVLLLSSVVGAYHLGQGHREEEEVAREEMVVFKEKAVQEGVPEAAPGELEAEKEH
jgi:NADH-quinone oxidoreductase subunit J